MGQVRVLIVEDQGLVREGLARSLGRRPGFAVVGACARVNDAVEMAEVFQPDVVLLDYELDGARDERFLKETGGRGLAVRVLVLTGRVSQAEARRLTKEGARGIISKDRPLEELCDAIRAVAGGGSWFRADRMLGEIELPPERHGGNLRALESAALQCLVSGMTDDDIAVALGIPAAEVARTLRGLPRHACVRTRAQLVREALERRWLCRDGGAERPT